MNWYQHQDLMERLNEMNARLVRIETRVTRMMLHSGLKLESSKPNPHGEKPDDQEVDPNIQAR